MWALAILDELMKAILSNDLENIYDGIGQIWVKLDRSRLFLTGGTGCFGRWLLRSFKHAYESQGINVKVVVLSRDPSTFAGFVLSVLSALVGIFYLGYKLLAWNDFDLGLAPLIIEMFFFASVQLFFIGIVGGVYWLHSYTGA